MSRLEGEGLQAQPPPNPDQIVGRTVADLFFHSNTGPKLDRACARLTDWVVGGVELAWRRVTKLLQDVDKRLEEADLTPQEIPERVGLEIIENVAKEEREELHELWAKLMTSAAQGFSVDAFHIDLVRRLDVPSSQLFHTVAGAWSEAIQRYPDLKGPAAFGRHTEQQLTAQLQYEVYAKLVTDGPPAKQFWAGAIARLDALGLVDANANFRPTRAGWELISILNGRPKSAPAGPGSGGHA